MTNAILTKATSTVSKNSDDERVRYKMDSYILHALVLVLVTILLFIIAICYHYAKQRSKQKNIGTLTI